MLQKRLTAALSRARPWLRPALERLLPVCIPTGLLAHAAIGKVLLATGGTPAVPLDDAYIHFQFARSFANLEPLVYCPDTPPVAGATSLLFPMLLGVPYALGVTGHAIVWAAWFLGFLALGLLADEARITARKFAGPVGGIGAGALVLAFGANAWFAASGMEVVPLAWLMLRAVRRAAEWCEGVFDGRERRGLIELVALCAAASLMRPEGIYAALLVAVALAAYPRKASRWLSLLALFTASLPFLANLAFTGSFVSTTAQAKWLPLSPYSTTAALFDHFVYYVKLLAGTLLNGEVWTALFLPRGSAPFALASLVALVLAARSAELRPRALLLFLLALGSLIPATYECYLCNRVRYLWPFAPAWFVGAAVFAKFVGTAFARLKSELENAGSLVLGGFVGALAGQLPGSLDDLAVSARAIFDQQVSLGLWAEKKLPKAASIGVNDTGAIAYFSGRRTFDVVGLTTSGEARYWTAGAGSRFEHYERLGSGSLPSHFIVYPEWFALEPLLGRELTERYVPGATILGGQRMIAYEADYTLLGSGHAPATGADLRIVDRFDVADLESEAAHGYVLGDARKDDNVVRFAGARVDGGRRNRDVDSFWLDVVPGGTLLLRVGAEMPTELEVFIGTERRIVEAPFDFTEEVSLELPERLPPGRTEVRVVGKRERFTSLHYFSLAP